MYDSILIGLGPASISASLYLKRAGLNILLIGSYDTSLKNAKIENYYGFLGSDGKTLFENGITQLKNNNIEYLIDEVIKIEALENEVIVYTKNNSYKAKYLVMGMGKNKNIDEKFKKYLGFGVSLCAHCDAPLYKDKTINVSGIEPYLSMTINELKLYSNDINVIEYDDIHGTNGEYFLEEIIMKDGKVNNCNNLFLALPISSNSLLFTLGIQISDDNYIKVNENYRTSIKNIYAIGDMVKGVHQVISSAYSGMVCALDIIKERYISENLK